MLEIGVSSPGNEVNVMLKNVCDLMFATLAFFFFGYGIAFGEPSNGFSKYFLLYHLSLVYSLIYMTVLCLCSGYGRSELEMFLGFVL